MSNKDFKKLITKQTRDLVKQMIKESSGGAKKKEQPAKVKQEDGVGSYRVTVRPKNQYTTFRTQEVVHGLKRVAGKTFKDKRMTVTWLVSKDCAKLDEKENLIITNKQVEIIYKHIKGKIIGVDGDVFKAEPSFFAPDLPPPVVEEKKKVVATKPLEKQRRVPPKKPLTPPTKKAKILAAKAKRKG